MKTFKLLFVAVTAIAMSSCSYTIYNAKSMAQYYQANMKSDAELEAKSNVHIFLNEKDIKCEYEVLSFMTYTPFPMNTEKIMTKKFYRKAVTKAYELGGNGIVIYGGGFCKVIYMPNAPLVSNDPSSTLNVIFDREPMDKFKNGEISKLEKKSEARKQEKVFEKEIKTNIEMAKELDEVDFIRKKIDIFEKYNSSLAKPKSSISNSIEDLRDDLNKVEKKIKRRIAREEKKAERAKAKAQTK